MSSAPATPNLPGSQFLSRRGRASLAGRVHAGRVGTYLAAVAFGGFVAAAALSGCAPAWAKGAPLTTPNLSTTRSPAAGPVKSGKSQKAALLPEGITSL